MTPFTVPAAAAASVSCCCWNLLSHMDLVLLKPPVYVWNVSVRACALQQEGRLWAALAPGSRLTVSFLSSPSSAQMESSRLTRFCRQLFSGCLTSCTGRSAADQLSPTLAPGCLGCFTGGPDLFPVADVMLGGAHPAQVRWGVLACTEGLAGGAFTHIQPIRAPKAGLEDALKS